MKDKQSLVEWIANNYKNFGAALEFVTNRHVFYICISGEWWGKACVLPPPSLILCYFKGSNIVRDFHQSLVLPFRTRDFHCRELLLSGFCKKKEKNRPIFCLQLTHTNTCTNFLVPVNNTEKRFNSFYLGDNSSIAAI